MEGDWLKILLVAVLTFLINIPFGYWRSKVRKLSKEWFLAVHLPVPFIVFFRILFGVKLNLYTLAIFVISFFVGQRVGIVLNNLLMGKLGETSKNLFGDLLRLVQNHGR
ncbi:MAG TPA: hypothetical protein EYH48_00535 [Aquifex aeolicus]|uniref:Uncharacterized protein n=1 Tax=Aquifex aeolicus TaxID=63363 RepID=A0A9D1CET1_AQUAO|nr:hypothetical protein [Aquificales bacterium]HIP86438.1 hypothetical protein [Aquifex sp.]HIP98200.1 hypothetical protein [Aquifex aeolicus]HIQ25807.1 hypothetical protein [Aquifex aeolicus]